MDLGIAGRRAVVCGSSRGLGRACAEALVDAGVHVVANGRDEAGVEATAAALRERAVAAGHPGVAIDAVAADLTTAAGRDALLAVAPAPDILVTNGAGPAPGLFADHDVEAWRAAVEGSMLAPLDLIRRVLPAMRERRFGRVVLITSAMVKSPHPLMALSIGPRTGLTGVAKAVSREVAADGVTVNCLLPERFDTDRQRHMAELAMAVTGATWEEARAEQVASIAAGRLGRPEELGATCAFLCSVHAGYISGQNLQLDGGSYEGLI